LAIFNLKTYKTGVKYMKTSLFALLFLAFASHGQELKRLAILNTEDDGEPPIESTDLGHLTNRLREIAVKALPKNSYSVMTQQSIIDKTGSRENAAKACREAQGCLAQLGRKISANYIGQARLGRFGGNLTISMELYNSTNGGLIDSFTGDAKDVFGLLRIIDEKAPDMFVKMPGVISSEPPSTDGLLEIKIAYLDGIGKDKDWSLSINGKAQPSYENKLPPGNYNVVLSHECYENASFKANINRGKREVFDMAGNITLKKGGLDLRAEQNGEPVSEPVFVNGKQVGETPFSGSVPLCAKVEIGKGRERVNVVLKYNEKVKHTHRSSLYVPPPELEEPYTPTPAPIPEEVEPEKPIKTSFWVAIGLDVLGALFVYAGYSKHEEMWRVYDEEYRGHRSDFNSAWENVESNRSMRNTFYVIGSLVLASGIGVHIWF
jgi:hypothetical protein